MKTPDTNAKRILVVEDEPAIGELCRRVLTGEGFEVDLAASGKAAQGMIKKQQYDLFLFDIRLPVVNGIELYQWLQDKYPQLTSRVIFTTGSVIGVNTINFMRETGRPYLPKPFNHKELATIVMETYRSIEN